LRVESLVTPLQKTHKCSSTTQFTLPGKHRQQTEWLKSNNSERRTRAQRNERLFLFPYNLTPSTSATTPEHRVLLEKLTAHSASQEIPQLYGT
jgi:hypothetical protein